MEYREVWYESSASWFLFFINKLPGITIKSLLEILEISKQGSHATLQKLKEQGLIIEKVLETDRRVKKSI